MTAKKITLKESIARQRENLIALLKEPLRQVAEECSRVWGDREQLDAVLMASLARLPHCKYHYVLDSQAIQISDNISREGIIVKDFGRDRSQRPYVNEVVPSTDFLLSEAYISLRAKRPSLTAIQIVRDADGEVLGFVGRSPTYGTPSPGSNQPTPATYQWGVPGIGPDALLGFGNGYLCGHKFAFQLLLPSQLIIHEYVDNTVEV